MNARHKNVETIFVRGKVKLEKCQNLLFSTIHITTLSKWNIATEARS